MLDTVEGGATLAWRLLATLEGGSLLLATSALVAYSVRNKIRSSNRSRRTVKTVLVTNTTGSLGGQLKKRLEEQGCVVETPPQMSEVTNDASSEAGSVADAKVDAIVVIGAEPKVDSLDGIANLVTEDVYHNLRVLESMSVRVHQRGYIVWACASDGHAPVGSFRDAGAAFDTVIRASVLHIAKLRHCEPIWVGRCESAELTAERTVATLLSYAAHYESRFSVRYTAHRLREYLDRWLKVIT